MIVYLVQLNDMGSFEMIESNGSKFISTSMGLRLVKFDEKDFPYVVIDGSKLMVTNF